MAKENQANKSKVNSSKPNSKANSKSNNGKPKVNKTKASAKRNALNARQGSMISLGVILLLIVCTALLAFNGYGQGRLVRYMQPWHKAIGLGLDLRGGASAIYQAKALEGEDGKLDSLLDGAVGMLRTRLANQGIAEATVVKLGGDRIRVEISETLEAGELLDSIFTRAHLKVKDPDSNVLLDSGHVQSVRAVANSNQVGGKYVEFTLTPEGRQLYSAATKENIGKAFTVELDDQVLSTLNIDSAISSGKIYIGNGAMTDAQASSLVSLIQLGALPLDLERTELTEISATLGVKAMDTIMLAFGIALVLIAAFLLLRYRLLGLVSVIALAIYDLLVLFLLAVFGAQLTLPGVVGIAISACLAVDANILSLERFREEAKGGRSMRNALRSGYLSARPAIVDSSIVAIIVALVLLQFGSGTVRSLALTLVTGMVTSLFTALFVTRWLLRLFVGMGLNNRQLNVD